MLTNLTNIMKTRAGDGAKGKEGKPTKSPRMAQKLYLCLTAVIDLEQGVPQRK